MKCRLAFLALLQGRHTVPAPSHDHLAPHVDFLPFFVAHVRLAAVVMVRPAVEPRIILILFLSGAVAGSITVAMPLSSQPGAPALCAACGPAEGGRATDSWAFGQGQVCLACGRERGAEGGEVLVLLPSACGLGSHQYLRYRSSAGLSFILRLRTAACQC